MALERSLYRFPSLRNKLLPVCRTFPILCEKAVNSGDFGVVPKSLSLTAANKQTTFVFSNLSDFAWKINLFWSFWRWNEVCIAVRRQVASYFRYVELFRLHVKNQFILVILALERSLYRFSSPRIKVLLFYRIFPYSCEQSIYFGHFGVGTKSVSLAVAKKQFTFRFSNLSDFAWKVNLFWSFWCSNEVLTAFRRQEANYFRVVEFFRFNLKNQFILVILALERSLYRLPSPRNKLLPASRIFTILCEKSIHYGHIRVGTKSISHSVAKMQTTSGMSNLSDFTWRINLFWSFWRWNEVCIACRRQEIIYFPFLESFRFCVESQSILVILVFERSLYRFPSPT